MDVSDQARAVRRRWTLVAGIVVVGLLALGLFGRGPGPTYSGTHVVLFQETGTPTRDAFARDLQAAAALAKTPNVAARVAARLNAVNTPADLARKITSHANLDANTIEIVTVPYGSASKASQLADGFAAELESALGDQQSALTKQASDAAGAEQESTATALKNVEAKLAAAAKAPVDQQEILRTQRDALLRHLQETIVANLAVPPQQSLTSLGSATTQKVDHGRLAPTTIPGWMLAAGLLGFLGGAVALLAERLDGRLHSRSGVERAFGLPVLAEVPPLPPDGNGHGVVAATQPLSEAADAFRDLRTSLARLGRPGRHGTGGPRGNQLELTAALVTSAGRGEGKTSAAVNLAAAVAETGRSVLVIDCDMRAPQAHDYLGVARGPGLSDVLAGSATIDQVAVPTSVPGVHLVGAGLPVDNPAALLSRQQDFVALARMMADFVVLDAPPLAVHDAAELVWMVDAVVVSCRSGDTTTKDATRVNELLGMLGAPPSGVVLMGADHVGRGNGHAGNGGSRRAEALAAPPSTTPPLIPPLKPAASATTSVRIPAPRPRVTVPSSPFAPPPRVAPPPLVPPPAGAAIRQVAAPDLETADWATRPQPLGTAADSESIRRQLALPVRRIAGWAGTVALMLVMWVVIRTFLFQSFYIPSPSMAPALKPGDRVLVSKLSYELHDVRRGDIVVFKRPPHVQAGPEVKDLVKRVIGLPGDTVEARDGQVLVNGKALKEPYVAQGASTSPVSPTHIPAEQYWVMGDNRTVSEDSRYFGTISGSLIVGRVFFQVWPVSSVGFV
jgi:signal peptidase I